MVEIDYISKILFSLSTIFQSSNDIHHQGNEHYGSINPDSRSSPTLNISFMILHEIITETGISLDNNFLLEHKGPRYFEGISFQI